MRAIGSDAIELTTKELEAQIKEIEDWKKISLSTDY